MERGESGEHGVGNWSSMLGHLGVITLITTVVVLLQRLFKPRKTVSVSPGGSA
jgi:predicted lipid-binding transport protein (Tim44 family)